MMPGFVSFLRRVGGADCFVLGNLFLGRVGVERKSQRGSLGYFWLWEGMIVSQMIAWEWGLDGEVEG